MVIVGDHLFIILYNTREEGRVYWWLSLLSSIIQNTWEEDAVFIEVVIKHDTCEEDFFKSYIILGRMILLNIL